MKEDYTPWKFYTTSDQAWKAMYEDCEKATTSIDFEEYILKDNGVGSKFFDLLIKKASSGVRVRLIIDAVGTFNFSQSRSDQLVAAGVELQFFKPFAAFRLLRLASLIHRDHRKILIIDNTIGYIGGIGIDEKMADWRDTQVRMTNSVVPELSDSFETMWRICKSHTFSAFAKPAQNLAFHISTNAPRNRHRFLKAELTKAIQSAKQSIYIMTPFIIPNRQIYRLLKKASRRGIEVRILLDNMPEVKIVRYASHSYIEPLLKSGVRIFKYQPSILHGKTSIIDNTWSTVGSMNLDMVSLMLDYEANVVSTDTRFIEEVKEQFLQDLKNSEELTLKVWGKRPFWQKTLEGLTAPFHYFL